MGSKDEKIVSGSVDDTERLKALVALGGILSDAGLELEKKLQICVETLRSLAKAEQASLMLVREDDLVVAAATNHDLIGLSTPLTEESISTEVVRSAEALYVKDLAESPYAKYRRDGDKSSYRTRSLICLPLMEGSRVVGVLNLSDKEGSTWFDQDDLDLTQSIARQVARLINFSALHSRLESAYRELNRTQKAKEELMQLILHDMKAPITGVKELFKLLGPQGGLNDQERGQYMALAEGDLELLWRRITNLLDLNRMDSDKLPLNPSPVGLGDLVREAVDRLTAVCRVRQVEITTDLTENPEVVVDEDLVERIMVNLLFNALKFSSPEEGGGGRVEVKVASEKGEAVVEMTDTGPGVDPDLGEGIFERYSQGRPVKGSTGLGLYFCRRAAWLLGGEVGYRNLPSGGACFHLRLPLDEQD